MALGIRTLAVGHFTHPHSHTGCTVVLPPVGTVGGIAVRGGAPGTREAAVLGPQAANPYCHAVVLCGSSLFGLRAADGVVDWCEENGIGLSLPMGTFPIVGAAVVLDIREPNMRRLDASGGRAACENASFDEPAQGSVGVGTGCTVGKEAGSAWASKGGIGAAITRSGDVTVGALMAANALGSVYDEHGKLLAGCRAPEEHPRYPGAPLGTPSAGSLSNTVIGCVVTNARLDKAGACRVADLSHTGIARSVSPAHTTMDGDAIFALATGEVEAGIDLIAELSAQAVAQAVRSAVRNAIAMPGFPVDPRAM
jgi:L-aminopeptidase/D-esterase-like protein